MIASDSASSIITLDNETRQPGTLARLIGNLCVKTGLAGLHQPWLCPPFRPLFHDRSHRLQADLAAASRLSTRIFSIVTFLTARPISRKRRRAFGRKFPPGGGRQRPRMVTMCTCSRFRQIQIASRTALWILSNCSSINQAVGISTRAFLYSAGF